MEHKTSNRIWIGVVILLAIALICLVAVLIWRERSRRDEKKAFTETNLRIAFPGYFRDLKEQQTYFSNYIAGFENPTPVSRRKPSNRSCNLNCGFNQEGPARRRRSASVYHGCCESVVNFMTPTQLPNLSGINRTIVQLGSSKQYFLEHICSTVTACSGCQCAQEYEIHTGVVIKAGVTDPDDIDDVEIDLFRLEGCCRCVNV